MAISWVYLRHIDKVVVVGRVGHWDGIDGKLYYSKLLNNTHYFLIYIFLRRSLSKKKEKTKLIVFVIDRHKLEVRGLKIYMRNEEELHNVIFFNYNLLTNYIFKKKSRRKRKNMCSFMFCCCCFSAKQSRERERNLTTNNNCNTKEYNSSFFLKMS